MGLFKKLTDKAAEAGQAAAAQAQAPMTPEDVSAMQRAHGIDTAAFGGPSNAPVADDDPIWAPIEGIDLETYAKVAKKGADAGVTDEAAMTAIAQAEGLDPASWAAAAKGWTDRMGQNMAVGQRFRSFYDVA